MAFLEFAERCRGLNEHRLRTSYRVVAPTSILDESGASERCGDIESEDGECGGDRHFIPARTPPRGGCNYCAEILGAIVIRKSILGSTASFLRSDKPQ